jgi:hypothetical protein
MEARTIVFSALDGVTRMGAGASEISTPLGNLLAREDEIRSCTSMSGAFPGRGGAQLRVFRS